MMLTFMEALLRDRHSGPFLNLYKGYSELVLCPMEGAPEAPR